jgi:hypothetical protein
MIFDEQKVAMLEYALRVDHPRGATKKTKTEVFFFITAVADAVTYALQVEKVEMSLYIEAIGNKHGIVRITDLVIVAHGKHVVPIEVTATYARIKGELINLQDAEAAPSLLKVMIQEVEELAKTENLSPKMESVA